MSRLILVGSSDLRFITCITMFVGYPHPDFWNRADAVGKVRRLQGSPYRSLIRRQWGEAGGEGMFNLQHLLTPPALQLRRPRPLLQKIMNELLQLVSLLRMQLRRHQRCRSCWPDCPGPAGAMGTGPPFGWVDPHFAVLLSQHLFSGRAAALGRGGIFHIPPWPQHPGPMRPLCG